MMHVPRSVDTGFAGSIRVDAFTGDDPPLSTVSVTLPDEFGFDLTPHEARAFAAALCKTADAAESTNS